MTFADKSDFEHKIGYIFTDKELLNRALTHSSYANEHKLPGGSNERLEFLGDSVLSVITAEYLFKCLPESPEGMLTRIRASLVCERALAEYATEIGLGAELYLNSGEESTGGRERASVTADAFEALLAAVYLDGGADAARSFVLPFLSAGLKKRESSREDSKSALQETAQRKKGTKIEYILASESGPDHNKHFEVELYINGRLMGKGGAASKKEAEQAAAAEALKKYGDEN